MKWRLGGGWVIFFSKYSTNLKGIFGRLGLSSRIRMEAPTSTFLNQGFRQVQVLETMLKERCSNCLCLSKVPLCEFPRHSLDSRDVTCLARTEQVEPFSAFQVKLDNYKSFPMNFPRVVAQSKAIPFRYLRSIEY